MVLLTIVNRAIEEYNRYRRPEAEASIEGVDGPRFYILFRGSYCETCGLYDWIEDLVYVLDRYGLKASIESVEDVGDGGMLAVFKITPRRPVSAA